MQQNGPAAAAQQERTSPTPQRKRSSSANAEEPLRKRACSSSHVLTEQRRRDNINKGFGALRELIPHKDRMDKAALLMQGVEYIKQMQAVMRQLISMGATKNFSEDVQWAIRMLLPWQEDKPAGDASSRDAVLAGVLPDQKCRPYLLNQKQLAALTQPVEEAKAEVAPPAPAQPSLLSTIQQALVLQQQLQQTNGLGLFQLAQLLAAAPQAAGLSGCTGCSPSPNILQQLAGAAQSGACAQAPVSAAAMSQPPITATVLPPVPALASTGAAMPSQSCSTLPEPSPAATAAAHCSAQAALDLMSCHESKLPAHQPSVASGTGNIGSDASGSGNVSKPAPVLPKKGPKSRRHSTVATIAPELPAPVQQSGRPAY